MNWSRRHTLITSLALIGLTNAIALGGAAYNRSGEPESTLSLTERELRPPYMWTGRKENSGLALRLQWRLVEGDTYNYAAYYYSAGGGMPAWLDAAKMASLGFHKELPADPMNANRNFLRQRQLPRDVLVVLELDGPAFRDMLERAAKAAKEVESKNERGEGKKLADQMMDRESRRNSRLFAVDAGLDRAALRGKYPDRTKYAIVHGQVRPAWQGGTKAAAGILENLSAAEVNVPMELRSTFEGIAPEAYLVPNREDKHFEATLAFGQRLEPWLMSAAKK